jgi:hypothetical protein
MTSHPEPFSVASSKHSTKGRVKKEIPIMSMFRHGLVMMATMGLSGLVWGTPLAIAQQMMPPFELFPAMGVQVSSPQSGTGRHLLFHVVNPLSSLVEFKLPDMGVRYPVAATSERTFYLDRSLVMAPRIRHVVVDSLTGTQLASGTMDNQLITGPYGEVSTELANMMNYSTAYTAPDKPEPQYQERPVGFLQQPASQRGVIRGFW